MTITTWRAGFAAVVLAFAGYAAAQPATPQQQDSARQQVQQNVTQPYNNAPVWREVRDGDPGFTQVGAAPDQGVLIQSRGETWRQARVPVSLIGGLLVALAMLSLGGFYAMRGSIRCRRKRIEDDDPALSSRGSLRALDHGHRLGDPGHHRPDTHLRQGAAAADHRSHPLLLAGSGGEERPQLRRTDSDCRCRVDLHPLPAVQLAEQAGLRLADEDRRQPDRARVSLGQVQRRREDGLLVPAGPSHAAADCFRTGAELPELRSDAGHDADLQRHPHGARLCRDCHGLCAHLPGHDRHEGGVPRHAQRLCHGRVGQASPRALVQRRQGRARCPKVRWCPRPLCLGPSDARSSLLSNSVKRGSHAEAHHHCRLRAGFCRGRIGQVAGADA